MKTSRIMTVATALLLALLLLSVSIAVPILVRPYYYIHIDAFDLPSQTGFTKDEIKNAYNQMLDYCVGKTEEFSTGVFAWSEDGKSHFDDVSRLFKLDFAVIAVCGVALVALLLIKLKCHVRFKKILGRGPFFWAAVGLAVPFAIVGCLAAIDFNRAFTVFHDIFFAGKENWIFDSSRDEIITALPQDFFMNCAILILALMLLGCAVFVVVDLLVFREKSVYEPTKIPVHA